MKYAGIVVGIILIVVIAFATVKKVSPLSWGWWGETNAASGIALHGFDPISYFGAGEAAAGDPEISYQWKDATWQFSSEANKARFIESPDRYAPQFGGFCAFAVSKGFTADPSPDAWHIVDDKLFVFADTNVRDQWVTALPDGSLVQSEKQWRKRD